MAAPYFVVTWDYVGGDCGDFPWHFETEEEANACGEDWVFDVVADMRLQGDLPDEEGGEGWPVYHVTKVER